MNNLQDCPCDCHILNKPYDKFIIHCQNCASNHIAKTKKFDPVSCQRCEKLDKVIKNLIELF